MLWLKIVLTVYFGLKVGFFSWLKLLVRIHEGDEDVSVGVFLLKECLYTFFIVGIWIWL